jgi:hypothetical protein
MASGHRRIDATTMGGRGQAVGLYARFSWRRNAPWPIRRLGTYPWVGASRNPLLRTLLPSRVPFYADALPRIPLWSCSQSFGPS